MSTKKYPPRVYHTETYTVPLSKSEYWESTMVIYSGVTAQELINMLLSVPLDAKVVGKDPSTDRIDPIKFVVEHTPIPDPADDPEGEEE